MNHDKKKATVETDARLEEAFLKAVHKDPELRKALERMTEPKLNLKADWSCCIHVHAA